jgi:hypothetical protein
MVVRAINSTDSYNMAVVYGIKRTPIGKVMPHSSGSLIAFGGGKRRLGLFVTTDLAVSAILDCAKPPLTVAAYLEWFEALVEEEPAVDGAASYRVDADLL